VADLQTAFDAVDLLALEAVYDAAFKAYNDMQDAIDANDDIIAAQDGLFVILNDHLDALDLIIEDLQNGIDAVKISINTNEYLLADDIIDENELTAIIAAETAELGVLVNLRDGYLAIADEYWALYLAAIGG